jgi:hypothetical protein
MSENRIRIPCNGADIILAADKITSMVLQKQKADGGINFYVLDIRTVSNQIVSLHSDPRHDDDKMYLNKDALISIHNNFWEYLSE